MRNQLPVTPDHSSLSGTARFMTELPLIQAADAA